MQNALTFDVEDYFHVHNFETTIDRSEWDSMPSRVVSSTRRILGLLRERQVRATFFVLGWVAERHPQLVQEITADGHELATHGYGHELIYRQSPAEFTEDVERSLRFLKLALGGSEVPIQGYRAPAFSVTRQTLWALRILREHGFRYDSSIFPLVAHDRYGIRNASRFASQVEAGLWEFPVSTVRLAGRNWPVAGGGYFRLFPLWLTRSAIRHINGEGHPAVIYLHSWEFDPNQPAVRGAPALSRFRHYVNLRKTESRLRKLLEEFRFGAFQDVFAHQLGVS
ncbi:MAG TPA: XrtA system polysaccharide deacetylase [Vicinamibacteria bacterium]|nr:XrtA system polysaccharide deacetylase [Vicinamibacteria bacterium]